MSTAWAQQTPAESALAIVPADAAFFASLSRQREQFDLLRNSKAFARLMEIPEVRKVLDPLVFGRFDADDPESVTIQQWMSQPAVQVGLDALSHEIFIYGDGHYTRALEQAGEMARRVGRARLEALAEGKSTEQAERIANREMSKWLAKFRIPGIVVGLKTSDPLRARSQLMLLDGLIFMALASQDVPPAVRKAYGRETIHGQQFLTLELKGSMLPLEQIDFEDDVDPETVAAVMTALRRLQLTLAVGFYEDYAILSLGGSLDHLKRLGQEEPLADHADLARLRDCGPQRYTSITYAASDFRTAAAAGPRQLAGLTEWLETSAGDGEDLSDDTKAKVAEALAALEDDLEKKRPQQEALLAYSYLTETGYEGYRYDTVSADEHPDRPLNVLRHVGREPLAVLAHHDWIGDVDDYDQLSQQLAENLIKLQQAIDLEDVEAQFMWNHYQGLIWQLDAIAREKIVPALADGQAAFVFAAADRSPQWHPEMPASAKPLALPELGFVVETNNPELLIEGIEDAYATLEELIELTGETTDEFPPLAAQVEETPAGRIYSVPIWPELTKIDPNLLAPSAGFSDRWLALALRPKTVETLLKPTGWKPPVQATSDPRGLIAVAHFDLGRTVQVGLDWFDYAEQLSAPLSDEDQAILTAYRAALNLAACLRSYTRTCQAEGDEKVTHSVWHFEDRP